MCFYIYFVFSVKTLDFETLGEESASLYDRENKPSNVIRKNIILVKRKEEWMNMRKDAFFQSFIMYGLGQFMLLKIVLLD